MLNSIPSIDRPSLHPGTRYLIRPRVPHGLVTVVEGLTREILRHRPEDMYVFAAHHFEKLLKLREQHHIEEYNYAFNSEFGRDFNLRSVKESTDSRSSYNDWSLGKKAEILERHRKVLADLQESSGSIFTDKEKQTSKQTCLRDVSSRKRASKKSTKDNKMMSTLHKRDAPTKHIKRELERNELSNEKEKATNGTEKEIRSDRRSKVKAPKSKSSEEGTEHATMTISNRASVRRPLRKVRQIETESETETEYEVAANARPENGHERSNIKYGSASRETGIGQIRDGEEKSESIRLSELSSERKVSSRALNMDRIRAYVLRKFASSSASLEVLSPTYAEQIQQVIDHAAPIIKEKLEEIGRLRGKRSRSLDHAWNSKSHRRCVQGERKDGDYEGKGRRKERAERRKNGEELEREADTAMAVDSSKLEDRSMGKDRTILKVEREERKARRRSASSGKRLKRHESEEQREPWTFVRQIGENSKSNKSELDFGITRDTSETRPTTARSILGDTTTSELNGVQKIEQADGEHESLESKALDRVVSLPIVRPPSAKSYRNATRNGSDSLTLPPISPEAPRSTRKTDELSLPVLTSNGNHFARKLQEQDDPKNAEEASTIRDITSDMDDVTIPSENDYVDTITNVNRSAINNNRSLTSAVRTDNEEKNEKDEDVKEEVLRELTEERASEVSFGRDLEEPSEGSVKPEERTVKTILNGDLNVAPEVMDAPLRANVTGSDEEEGNKLRNENADPACCNTFDGLKDKLIEIEMVERSIEKALAGQPSQAAISDGETTSEAKELTTDGEMNETRKPINKTEGVINEKQNLTDEKEISNKREGSTNEVEELTKEIERPTNEVKGPIDTAVPSTNQVERVKREEETSMKERGNSKEAAERRESNLERAMNEMGGAKNELKVSKGEVESTMSRTNIPTKAEETPIEDERSVNKARQTTNETREPPNGVQELMVKRHIESLGSVNSRSQSESDRIDGVAACGTNTNGSTTASASKAETANAKSLEGTDFENATVECQNLRTNLLDESRRVDETEAEKGSEIEDELPATTHTPLSLSIPFSYVLSEGSPCEIPDSVTTVIIPDRSCSSPVIFEMEDRRLKSTNSPVEEEGSVRRHVAASASSKDEAWKGEKRARYGMEIFGEYIPVETAILPFDIDLVRDARSVKLIQDKAVVRNELSKIKEEKEQEEEKERDDDAAGGKESHFFREKNDDDDGERANVQDGRTVKLAIPEDVELEENEEIDAKALVGRAKTEGSLPPRVPECRRSSDVAELGANVDLTDERKTGVATETRSTLENSMEESESSQDTRTTTSSDAKESTASNRSIESPSAGVPIVPELNLDSIQDNTVSSFKMTMNGAATRESNSSPRESDATTSLIEPLTSSDETLMIGKQSASIDREQGRATVEKLAESSPRNPRSEISEVDRASRRAEHAGREWLEKDPSFSETNLKGEVKPQREDIAGSEVLPKNTEQTDLPREKREELSSEEEIARELIVWLDEETQSHGVKSHLTEELKNNGKSVESFLSANERSDRPSESIRSIMDNKSEKREAFSKGFDDEKIAEAELINQLSDHEVNISQNKEKGDTMIHEETEKSELKMGQKKDVKIQQIPSVAQFEQDAFLEPHSRHEVANEYIRADNKLDVIDADDSVKDKKSKDEQTNVDKIFKNQSKESIKNIEEFDGKQKESEQEKLKNQEKCERIRSKEEEECRHKFQTQEKDDQANIKLQKEIADVKAASSEEIKSRTNLTEESTDDTDDNDNVGQDTRVKSIIRAELAIDNRIEKDEKNENEKIEDLSANIKSDGSITAAISKESTEDHPHNLRWTMGTTSSTMETVIAVSNSNITTDENMEVFGDTSEVIEDKSIMPKQDNLYSAIKIQACIRGFLTRRRMQKSLHSKFVSNNVPSPQKISMNNLTLPNDCSILREAKIGRRLRREEALRKTTLSLENAFATSRLQHTGELHDSIPLPVFDMKNNEANSTSSNESLSRKTEEDVKQAKYDVTGSGDENNYGHSA